MSDTAGYAVTLPASQLRRSRLAVTEAHSTEVDITAVHSFAFAPERWLTGVGSCVQGSLMIGVGAFLLTQVSSTPNLAVQIAIVGTLLAAGGLAFIIRSYGDFFGGLTIDRQGVRARVGLKRFELPWSEVRQWRVDEHCKMPELSCIELWTKGESSQGVPGGSLGHKDLHRARHILEAFAPEKQQL